MGYAAGGITVPVTILEQLTYLFFVKLESQFAAKQQEFKEI